jgi:hypothetical protein
MKNTALWNVTPCSLIGHRRIGGMYCLHHQELWINQASNHQEAGAKGTCCWLFAWQTLRRDDGRSMFLRNLRDILPDSTAPHNSRFVSVV